jgi:hypothetical protein
MLNSTLVEADVGAEVAAVVVAPEQVLEGAALASVGGGTAWGAW